MAVGSFELQVLGASGGVVGGLNGDSVVIYWESRGYTIGGRDSVFGSLQSEFEQLKNISPLSINHIA